MPKFYFVRHVGQRLQLAWQTMTFRPSRSYKNSFDAAFRNAKKRTVVLCLQPCQKCLNFASGVTQCHCSVVLYCRCACWPSPVRWGSTRTNDLVQNFARVRGSKSESVVQTTQERNSHDQKLNLGIYYSGTVQVTYVTLKQNMCKCYFRFKLWQNNTLWQNNIRT